VTRALPLLVGLQHKLTMTVTVLHRMYQGYEGGSSFTLQLGMVCAVFLECGDDRCAVNACQPTTELQHICRAVTLIFLPNGNIQLCFLSFVIMNSVEVHFALAGCSVRVCMLGPRP
jgi:hypothetical protein